MEEAIQNYLKMDNAGAFLISGTWGCGKSYYFKNRLIGEIKQWKNVQGIYYKPLIVSLFGMTDGEKVLQEVFIKSYKEYDFSSESPENRGIKGTIKKLKRKTTSQNSWVHAGIIVERLIGRSEFLSQYLNISGLASNGKNLVKLLDKQTVIIFDDFERLPSGFKKDDFLGLVNELVENQGLKVIIVANLDEIHPEEIRYKEKVIEKTIEFQSDTLSIFREVVNSYSDQAFKDFMTSEFVIHTIDSSYGNLPSFDLKGYRDKLKNIRTLKFAIEHFCPIFDGLIKSNPLTEQERYKLNNVWCFVLSVSIHFKAGHLLYEDNKGLDQYVSTAKLHLDLGDTLDPNLFIEGGNDVDKEDQESQHDKFPFVIDRFISFHYTRLEEPFRFYPSVYRFICGGENVWFEEIEESVIREATPDPEPGMVVLESFLRNLWSLSDDEFPEKLRQLYASTETGSLNGIVSYVNAATYLLHYGDICGYERSDTETAVQHGIDLYLERVGFNHIESNSLSMIGGEVPAESQPIVTYAQNALARKAQEAETQQIKELEAMFMNDMTKFAQFFLPQDGTVTMPVFITQSILEKFNMDKVKERVENLRSQDIAPLSTFIRSRYIQQQSHATLRSEIAFLEAVCKGLDSRDYSCPTLGNHLIRDSLRPNLNKAIRILIPPES